MPNSQYQKTSQKKTVGREEFDFFNFLRHYGVAFKRFFSILLTLSFLITAGVFAYCKLSYNPQYKCTVTFLATPLTPLNTQTDTTIYHYQNTEGLGSQLAVSFPQIFETGVLKDIVCNELGVSGLDGEIHATASPATNYFELTVISSSPESAKNIADSLLRNYPRVVENVLGDISADVKIPAKTPTSPYNKNDYLTWVFMAFVGSFAIGMVLICIYVVRRKTICSKNDVKVILNQNYLCEIPLISGKNTREHEKFKTVIRSKSFTESMRTLKNRTLSTLSDSDYRTIGFVSTSDNEGKTCVGAGFAKVLSSTADPVIFITFEENGSHEAGQKKRRFNKKPSTVDVIKNMSFDKQNAVLPHIKRLFTNVDLLLLDTKIIHKKDALKDIIEQLKSTYSYVIMDVVAGASHSEAVKFADLCDAYISVVRCDYISSDKIKATLNYFSYSTSHNLGSVLNEVSSAYISYGRYTSYGKYSKYGYSYYYRNYGYGQYGNETPDNNP